MSHTGAPLRLVESGELTDALRDAMAGGPPVAPLSPDPVERRRALAVLQPEHPVTEPDAAAVLITSGTSGTPKPVVLSRTAIRAAVAATHQRLGGPGDWVLALPYHYVAGFMVQARAVLAGTRLRPVRTDLADLSETVDDTRRYLSMVPTQLARAAQDPGVWAALGDFDAVLLGGGAAEAALVARALAEGISLVTTYGMTETCGGVVYDGRPLDGVSVELDAEDRILMGGPMLFSGYRLRPKLTTESLVDGRLRTADRGRWHHGRLQVLGRLDDVIISGGLTSIWPRSKRSSGRGRSGPRSGRRRHTGSRVGHRHGGGLRPGRRPGGRADRGPAHPTQRTPPRRYTCGCRACPSCPAASRTGRRSGP